VRALTLLALACASCSYTTDAPAYVVLDAGIPFALADSFPPNGATGVPLASPIVLTFTDFPDAASFALYGPITLRSGRNAYDFDARVDLGSRSIVVVPRSPLVPDAAYTLFVTSSLLSLGGAALSPPVALTFTAGSSASFDGGLAPPDGSLPPPRLRRTLAADVQPIFDSKTASCNALGCHSGSMAMAGMDLSTIARSAASLIGVPSSERTEQLRVAPGDSARSYLLHKLLGTPDIAGGQMPLGLMPLPPDQIRVIDDWIAAGAPIE